MTVVDPAYWSELQRQTLASYDEALLRQVAARLVKPRNEWPVDDLIQRSIAAAANPVIIDRRLQELTPPARRVLALVGHSRQPCWNLGHVVELTIALGHSDGLQPVLELLEAGLLYPRLSIEGESTTRNGSASRKIKSFEQWLAAPGPGGLVVFTPPQIAARALGEDLGLPDLSIEDTPAETLGSTPGTAHEADGLEWPLRLAVLWQQVASAPLRRTLQRGFFKRDFERLQQDPLLNAVPADHLADVPDLAFLMIALAEQEGMIKDVEGELQVGQLPSVWEKSLATTLEALWVDLLGLSTWNPQDGWRGGEPPPGNPFPSAYLLALLLLARLPERATVRPETLEQWLVAKHPYWTNESLRPSRQKPWLETFLLGVAYQLRLVQAVRGESGAWRVRLTATGRWLASGAAELADHCLSSGFDVQPDRPADAFRGLGEPGRGLHLATSPGDRLPRARSGSDV
jgi:hypothetical protein